MCFNYNKSLPCKYSLNKSPWMTKTIFESTISDWNRLFLLRKKNLPTCRQLQFLYYHQTVFKYKNHLFSKKHYINITAYGSRHNFSSLG